jgi:hypothetical protein
MTIWKILYAIGDIHGCADLLQKLKQKISAGAAKRSGLKKLVFLGDHVDRGYHSTDEIDRHGDRTNRKSFLHIGAPGRMIALRLSLT